MFSFSFSWCGEDITQYAVSDFPPFDFKAIRLFAGLFHRILKFADPFQHRIFFRCRDCKDNIRRWRDRDQLTNGIVGQFLLRDRMDGKHGRDGIKQGMIVVGVEKGGDPDHPAYWGTSSDHGDAWTEATIDDLNGDGKADVLAASATGLGLAFFTGTGSPFVNPASGAPDPLKPDSNEADVFSGILTAMGVDTSGSGLPDASAFKRA